MGPRSRGTTCPSFDLDSPRREGAGNAGCTLHPRSRVQWVEVGAHEHTGSAEALRHSLRNGFTAYTCSPRRRIPFCHRRQRIEICLSPVGPTRLRWLDISHGCQNHTTSPYAAPSPAPPIGEMPTKVVAKALKRRSSAQTLDHSRENPPCDHDRARRRCVHRIQPRVRDDRDTPLLPGWTGGVIAVICPTKKAVYFFGYDWTGSIRLIWFNNFR
jgi:hypothetical protein